MTDMNLFSLDDGKLSYDLIRRIHDFLAPNIPTNGRLLLCCGMGMCDDLDDINWSNGFIPDTAGAINLNYQSGVIPASKFGHEITLLMSRTLPAKTCYAAVNDDCASAKTYQYYPYSFDLKPSETRPTLPAIHA